MITHTLYFMYIFPERGVPYHATHLTPLQPHLATLTLYVESIYNAPTVDTASYRISKQSLNT